jgi:hypothetical protein
VLIYLAAPDRLLIGRAELTSPGRSGEVVLAQVEDWVPPVPMSAVLAHLPIGTAPADFDTGVVRITADEYENAVAVAVSTGSSPG